jgi:hypothetical protein
MVAAVGNTYAAKDKRWRAAIERALDQRSRAKQIDALDDLAEKLLQACDAGELAALKELGDRLDGKAAQTLAGDPDRPLTLDLIGELVRRKVTGNPNA